MNKELKEELKNRIKEVVTYKSNKYPYYSIIKARNAFNFYLYNDEKAQLRGLLKHFLHEGHSIQLTTVLTYRMWNGCEIRNTLQEDYSYDSLHRAVEVARTVAFPGRIELSAEEFCDAFEELLLRNPWGSEDLIKQTASKLSLTWIDCDDTEEGE